MVATATPGLALLINGSPRFLTTGTGTLFTADSPVPLQLAMNGASATSAAFVTIFDNGAPRYIAGAQAGTLTLTYTVPLAPGAHALTATSGTSNQSVSTPSAELDLFVLPAPVDRGITTTLSSTEFAGRVAAGYGLADLGDKTVVDSGVAAIQLVDGVLGLGINTSEVRIGRLYGGLLGRPADANGLAGYDVQLAGGRTLADVAAQIMAGPEYAAAHGTLNDAAFVDSLYRGFLGRVPDTAGAAGYLAQLSTGASRAAMASTFATSPEAIGHNDTLRAFARDATGTTINQLYIAGLGRTVDPGGLASSKALLAARPAADLAAAIAGSSEFAAQHGVQSDTAYVTSLYANALGRAPDAAGLQNELQRLASGASTRAGVLLSIATSAEATALLPTTI